MTYGHKELRDQLTPNTPQVVLVEGPEGIGKNTLLRDIAKTISPSFACFDIGRTLCTKNLMNSAHQNHDHSCEEMTESVAKHIVSTLGTRSRVPRTIVFDASRARERAMNILLKTLEEPPPDVTVLMSSTPSHTLPTIRSRAQLFRAFPLTDDEIEDLLMEWGVPRDRAHRAALISNGRPGLAKHWADALAHRGIVVQALKAGMEKDKILLAKLCAGLEPTSEEERRQRAARGEHVRGTAALRLLAAAIHQVRTGTQGLFDTDELYGLEDVDSRTLDRLAKGLHRPPRAELAIRSAVHELWRK